MSWCEYVIPIYYIPGFPNFLSFPASSSRTDWFDKFKANWDTLTLTFTPHPLQRENWEVIMNDVTYLADPVILFFLYFLSNEFALT